MPRLKKTYTKFSFLFVFYFLFISSKRVSFDHWLCEFLYMNAGHRLDRNTSNIHNNNICTHM